MSKPHSMEEHRHCGHDVEHSRDRATLILAVNMLFVHFSMIKDWDVPI